MGETNDTWPFKVNIEAQQAINRALVELEAMGMDEESIEAALEAMVNSEPKNRPDVDRPDISYKDWQ